MTPEQPRLRGVPVQTLILPLFDLAWDGCSPAIGILDANGNSLQEVILDVYLLYIM